MVLEMEPGWDVVDLSIVCNLHGTHHVAVDVVNISKTMKTELRRARVRWGWCSSLPALAAANASTPIDCPLVRAALAACHRQASIGGFSLNDPLTQLLQQLRRQRERARRPPVPAPREKHRLWAQLLSKRWSRTLQTSVTVSIHLAGTADATMAIIVQNPVGADAPKIDIRLNAYEMKRLWDVDVFRQARRVVIPRGDGTRVTVLRRITRPVARLPLFGSVETGVITQSQISVHHGVQTEGLLSPVVLDQDPYQRAYQQMASFNHEYISNMGKAIADAAKASAEAGDIFGAGLGSALHRYATLTGRLKF